MADDPAPEPGATDETRTDTETGERGQQRRGTSVEELAAKNRKLRERSDELEAILAEAGLGAVPTTKQAEDDAGTAADETPEQSTVTDD